VKKPEEIAFIKFVLSHDGRIPVEFWDDLTKQQYGYLEKWSNKDLWEYGVTMRSGWLTNKGREALSRDGSEG
jgi:hypothetical protein